MAVECPSRDGALTQLRSGSRTKTLPPALAEAVAGLLAGEILEQVATLVMTRTTYRLRNANGELVLEIVDDQVESGPRRVDAEVVA